MTRINVVEFNEDASVVVSGECYFCLLMITRRQSIDMLGSYDSTVKLWDLRYVPSITLPSVVHTSMEIIK